MTTATSQEMAALYRAESKLLERARRMRTDALVADMADDSLRAAALRGKAVGLHHGAQQIAAVARSVRALEVD